MFSIEILTPSAGFWIFEKHKFRQKKAQENFIILFHFYSKLAIFSYFWKKSIFFFKKIIFFPKKLKFVFLEMGLPLSHSTVNSLLFGGEKTSQRHKVYNYRFSCNCQLTVKKRTRWMHDFPPYCETLRIRKGQRGYERERKKERKKERRKERERDR